MSIPRCSRCHRPLNDPESVKRGFGARCFRRMNPGRKRRVKKVRIKAYNDWRQMDLPLEEEVLP